MQLAPLSQEVVQKLFERAGGRCIRNLDCKPSTSLDLLVEIDAFSHTVFFLPVCELTFVKSVPW
jgi:hypothetical protein